MLINVDINMHWTMTTISIVISTLKITVYTKKKQIKNKTHAKAQFYILVSDLFLF